VEGGFDEGFVGGGGLGGGEGLVGAFGEVGGAGDGVDDFHESVRGFELSAHCGKIRGLAGGTKGHEGMLSGTQAGIFPNKCLWAHSIWTRVIVNTHLVSYSAESALPQPA